MIQASLKLSNGQKFQGELIGAPLESSGELVFTTAMVGYCESLTDPSYYGQVLVFTYPLIGNYGVSEQKLSFCADSLQQFESNKIHAAAVIVANTCKQVFHWTSRISLDLWLKKMNTPGIVGLDTRELVQVIREEKQVFARIEIEGGSETGKSKFFRQDGFFDPNLLSVTKDVSCKSSYVLGNGKIRVAVYDFGIKWNILRQLISLGCCVEVLPWDAKPQDIDCNGWLLSNGPGNPQNMDKAIKNIAMLLEQEKPILGICFGHQLLSLAAGAKIEFMDYAHRSHNQPVSVSGYKKSFITSQNHNYRIKEDSLPNSWKIWATNINDGSIEGICHRNKPFRSVQFHPESSGGPRDTKWILKSFVDEVREHAQKN
jgi:carbamoyl-phosphate synthase small subunit